jgi:3',5'-cyclic AMP phosphodiesterase CpdA
MKTIYHVSDLHFGHTSVPEQIDVIEEEIRHGSFDVVALSGDLTQRARSGEFLRARSFIRDAARHSNVIVVPGNHDVRWWHSPLGIGDVRGMTRHYRRFIAEEMEPVLRIDGVTIVGLNTAQGVTVRTLTTRLRDISIIGDLTPAQLERAHEEFRNSPEGDCRVILMHHNPVKGELSRRHGLAHTRQILGSFAEMGVELVMCGHDHQEAIHYIEHTRRGTAISTAGTVCNRSRGGRPGSVNIISVSDEEIEVSTHVWSAENAGFRKGPSRTFPRGPRHESRPEGEPASYL